MTSTATPSGLFDLAYHQCCPNTASGHHPPPLGCNDGTRLFLYTLPHHFLPPWQDMHGEWCQHTFFSCWFFCCIAHFWLPKSCRTQLPQTTSNDCASSSQDPSSSHWLFPLFALSPLQVDCFVKNPCNLYHKNSPHLPDARVGGSTTMEVAAQCHMTPPLTMLTCSIDNKIALTFQREVNGATTFPALLGRWWQPNTAPLNDTKQHMQHLVYCFFFQFSKTSRKVLFLGWHLDLDSAAFLEKNSSGTFSGIAEMCWMVEWVPDNPKKKFK